ncbi:flagellin N-terminal helical domain-containing protein [Novosphingobium lentum]|uniref:flagellin N-terminal helical domain-containing protein n=1 Tax=Novosphingobium lentum TaxID=145287 RepID=UPI00082E7FA6|nr:flagellar biosynthesis protein FlgL [Novosphingobium lentum]
MTIIGTSTTAFYDRATIDMNALRTQANTLQSQISTGAKLTQSSDNPLAASQLRQLTRATTLSAIDTTAADGASSDLNLADNALTSFGDNIQRVQELATQAASSTLTDAQRAGIGTELGQIHGNLVALANSRDSAGHALFGGQSAGDAYTLDATGNAVYAGTASAGEVSLGEGQVVGKGVTGPDFLSFTAGGTSTDLMKVVKTLADALKAGGTAAPAAAKNALGSLQTALDSVTTSQTVVGSRLAWIDQTTQHRQVVSEARSSQQSTLGGTDIASTVAQLQQTMLVLQASQASFAKLSSLSLFDVLH